MAAPIDPVAQLLQAAAFTRQQVEALLKMGPAITLTAAQIISALGYTPVPDSRTLTAGAGLVGGGDLTVDRSFAIDPAVLTAIGNALPLTITTSSTNSVSGAGHTHALSATTVGKAFMDLANPSAVRYPRINADNSVTAITAATLASDIGLTGAYVLKSGDSMTGTLQLLGNVIHLRSRNAVVTTNPASFFDFGQNPTGTAGDNDGYLYARVGGIVVATANTIRGGWDASGNFSNTGVITAASTFQSSGVNAILANNGSSGAVFLRPNGAGSATGQTFVNSSGNMSVAGQVSAGTSVVATTNVQANNGIMRAQGFSGAADSGVYYLGDAALDNWMYKPSGVNAFLFRIGSPSPFTATLDAGGTIITSLGAAFSNGINFGNGVASGVTDLSRHIALYSTTYGFSITGGRLNMVVPSGASHRFVVNGVDLASIDAVNGLVVSGVNIACISGDMYSYRAGGTTGVLFLNNSATRYLYNNGTTYEMPGQGLNVGGAIADPNGNVRTIPITVQNASYTLQTSDFGRSVEKTGTGAINYTLGGAGSGGEMITIINSGSSGNITIVRSGVSLYRNGVNADVTVVPGTAVTIVRSSLANRWQC